MLRVSRTEASLARLTWPVRRLILSLQPPLSVTRSFVIRESSSVTCPQCGFPAPSDARTCSLCRALLHPVNLRRVALWAVVLVEYLVVANVLITH